MVLDVHYGHSVEKTESTFLLASPHLSEISSDALNSHFICAEQL